MSAPPVRLVHVTTVPETLDFLRGQIRYMKRQGFEVQCVSSPGELLQSIARDLQVTVQAVTMPRRITPLGDVAALTRLWRYLRRMRPHIIHTHTAKGGFLGQLAARLARVPVRIHHVHGLRYVTLVGCVRWLSRSIEKASCLWAHQVLSVSESVREMVVGESLCPAPKIKVLSNGSISGVDALGRFDPSGLPGGTRAEVRLKYGILSDALVVGFVGRIVRDKGVVELTEAWQELREEFPRLHLLVVGPFEPYDPVPADVQDALRSDARIHLVGVDRNTPPLFAAMDVVALPTYREGLPIVPLEAAAMALPVVTTSVQGAVDAVQDGVTGTLVPPRDGPALADAIRRYLDHPELRRRHGLAGRERVLRDFRQEAIWGATYHEYIRLLGEAGLPPPELAAGSAEEDECL